MKSKKKLKALKQKNKKVPKVKLPKTEVPKSKVRIYGQDTGSLSPEAVELCNNGDEAQLYHLINWLGGIKWRTNHDAADGRLKMTPELQNELYEIQYSQEYAVLKTTRFGTTIPAPDKEGEHVPRAEPYDRWFRWWKDYFESMSDEEFREYDKATSAKEDVSRFRPAGDWK